MLKATSMVLGTAILAIAALCGTTAGTATASGEAQVQTTEENADLIESSSNRKWMFHKCFKREEDAERECECLRSDRWECEVRFERGRHCVYKRRSSR